MLMRTDMVMFFTPIPMPTQNDVNVTFRRFPLGSHSCMFEIQLNDQRHYVRSSCNLGKDPEVFGVTVTPLFDSRGSEV
jgi:hypothetical protein